MPVDDVLDAGVVAGLRRSQETFGNPDFIRELVRLFEARTPAKIERARQALAEGNAEAVREVAHALRSNCGMLGAARMADACGRMEEAAARADLQGAAEAFREAETQLPIVLTALSTLVYPDQVRRPGGSRPVPD